MFTLKKAAYLIMGIVVLISCSAVPVQGPAFKSFESASDANSIIYVYWPGSNERLTFSISATDDKPSTVQYFTMKHGGYFAFEAIPGKLHLESSADFTFGQMALLDIAFTSNEELDITVEPDKEYYVRCNKTGLTGSYKLSMEIVDEQYGLREIGETKLIINGVDLSDLKAPDVE